MKLSEIYAKYSAPDGGGDKGTAHSYIEIYEKEITKTDRVSLLEIGVYQGHSLKMWQEYLTNSEVIGVDINKSGLLFDVNVLVADATNPIKALEGKLFDYIIDDGSHALEDQVKSLRLLWRNLRSGGKYFIEDISGDLETQSIENLLTISGISFRTYDNRKVKGRWDDILIVATKN